ncbi:hypothetical protein BGAL_0077g00150 [Botrytis galanthina]|uniref:Uncharacterized protein n=1 Tax=Botrytis galanthina TaxID=278940 RepID=A0A4S8R6L2_9HELO|nr:hypothetical protein BGAL_0077g00150 [Botrytis galanthina]
MASNEITRLPPPPPHPTVYPVQPNNFISRWYFPSSPTAAVLPREPPLKKWSYVSTYGHHGPFMCLLATTRVHIDACIDHVIYTCYELANPEASVYQSHNDAFQEGGNLKLPIAGENFLGWG